MAELPSKRSDLLSEAIEERIATGVYAPGCRLDEVELAEEFEVSRTPVREALIQLASMGLIELRPRRGAVVREIPPHRLCEMFEVMAELEGMCARLAARRITRVEIESLQQAHRDCEAARDAHNPDDYYHLNETFHRAIYAASHNGFLAEQATALHRQLRPYRKLQLRVRNRLNVSFSEHQGIVDAIVAGDAELAAERIRTHVVVQGERFADLVASLQALKAEQAAAQPDEAAA